MWGSEEKKSCLKELISYISLLYQIHFILIAKEAKRFR
jgi:hypothetical protein